MHTENNVHVYFYCGISATLIFHYKTALVALVSLANQPIFLCNQDARACIMVCKTSLTSNRMCVYTHKCAAKMVGKYGHSLIMG